MSQCDVPTGHELLLRSRPPDRSGLVPLPNGVSTVIGSADAPASPRRELSAWEAEAKVRHRVSGMRADLDRSFQKDRLEHLTGPELAPRFVLLHTLAHLLIRQLFFESGYTTASLRERIYARPEQDQCGILVYTAA